MARPSPQQHPELVEDVAPRLRGRLGVPADRRPLADYLQFGWVLLFLSFIGQIAWVWVDWICFAR